MNVLRGILTFVFIVLNTLLACIPLYCAGLVRLCLPDGARQRLSASMDRIIDWWVSGNRLLFRALGLTPVQVTIDAPEELARDRWYLVISNHQSWADILILQNTFRSLIPPIKFFTKQQLIWIPLLGLALWLLGFPYVKRLGKAQITANPELAALDREATLSACRGFQERPTAVLSFLEGTRFTASKHAAHEARFQHLLNPKLGGVSYVVDALSDRIHRVLDVTIHYPAGAPSFWDLVQGRCPAVEFVVESHLLPPAVRAATDADAARAELAPWIEELWRRKDARLAGARRIDDPPSGSPPDKIVRQAANDTAS